MKKIIMFVMVLAIGLTAGIANAALLAAESFEYTADASLEDQDGGTGWAGPWDRDMIGPAPGAPPTISAGSLEPPGVVGTGNHAEIVDNVGNAEEWFNRELTTPFLDDGSTYWVSVVFQKSNDDNASVWCGFAVGENIWFGKGYDMDNLVLWDNTGGDMETDVPATDLSWMVLKIETNPVAEEQVYLWVNPDTGAEPSIFTANANLEIPLLGPETTGGADFFDLEYGSSGTANSSDFKCDEIKIGTSFDDIVYYGGPENPINIDPNVMLVYETGETEGNFTVALKNPPVGQGSPGNPGGTPISVDIIVDPNGYLSQSGEVRGGGGNPDMILLGSSDPCDNRITFTKTAANWAVPEVIRFKAVDDSIAEPPTLYEVQNIAVWAVPTPHEPNLARPVAQKIVIPAVIDNDQANILFQVTPSRGGARVPVTGPVQIWEEPELYQGTPRERWRKIGMQLQVQPAGGPVKLNAEVTGEIVGDNLPTTVATLPFVEADDPNCYTFTSTTSSNGLGTGCPDHDLANKTTCWNVDQDIKMWGTDDELLQVEDAAAKGDQNYQAGLRVWIMDGGGDERYQWTVLADPCEPGSVDETFSLEKEVQIDIEDNECGAFGVLAFDVGNPNAFTDPNYRDSDGNPLPDCYVNIYDVIEIATKWLDCSYISDPACESYL